MPLDLRSCSLSLPSCYGARWWNQKCLAGWAGREGLMQLKQSLPIFWRKNLLNHTEASICWMSWGCLLDQVWFSKGSCSILSIIQ